MTYSVSISGHHQTGGDTPEHKAEERELLERLVSAVEDTEVLSFSFSGNTITAASIEEARSKLSEEDEPAEGDDAPHAEANDVGLDDPGP